MVIFLPLVKDLKMSKKIVLFILPFLFYSCWPTTGGDTSEPVYKPVTMERVAFEKSIALQSPQPIIKSGKIYIKGDLMFINDVNKGFHVYDYSNPKKPTLIHFIKAPGATDLAIIDEIIFINQAVDLVTATFDTSNNKLVVTNRNKNVFPQKRAPDGSFGNPTNNQIIIDWK